MFETQKEKEGKKAHGMKSTPVLNVLSILTYI